MDRQTRAAINLRDKIKKLVRNYERHEHLEVFVKDLKITARDIDILIREVADVK